ncbi:MAG TPA: DsrE family protein [Thermoanaerobaculia bacterium]|jgi:predicted peroxiredoxin
MTDSSGRSSWVVLLHRAEESALSEAAAMAAAATSLGISVTLVWFDGALDALVSGDLEEFRGESSAAALLSSARDTGLLRSLGCSASAVNRKLDLDSVRAAVDEIVGWPTVVSLIRASDKAFVW